MSKAWSLSAKIGAVGAAMLLLALASIGLTLSVTWKLEGGAAAVNEAGRMRMQTWRMAHTLDLGDLQLLQRQAAELDGTIELLRQGDADRPLFVPQDEASGIAFGRVRADWLALRSRWLAPEAPSPGDVGRDAQAFVADIDTFVTAVESQLSRWTAVLHVVQLGMTALAIAAAVALLFAAHLFVFDPLTRLRRGLSRIAAGEFAARVEVASRDEFGDLAQGFNRMAETLQELYQNLEGKVAEKTSRLQAQQQRLAALYEASASVARADSLDELARGFARHVRRVAGADAAAVRWSDEANQRYLLLGHDCLPARIVDGEACMPAGACACGQSNQSARLRVIPILGASDATRCAAEGFDTVVSVPVRMQDRMLGEIDLFFRHTPQLDDDDRSLLDALASHLASGMESLRAAALDREAAIAEERGLLARELHDSIAQSLAFLKIQVQLLRDAQARGQGTQAARALDELDTGIRESIADVRELLVHFRTRTNAEDIVPALQATLRKFEHQTGLGAALTVQGHGIPLAPDVQVQVLHVVQEALSNVRKHAGASGVLVNVQQGPLWRFEVSDDGRGFEHGNGTRAPDETHVGMRIMRERAASIGAKVDVESNPGNGTRVVLTVPTSQANPSPDASVAPASATAEAKAA